MNTCMHMLYVLVAYIMCEYITPGHHENLVAFHIVLLHIYACGNDMPAEVLKLLAHTPSMACCCFI